MAKISENCLKKAMFDERRRSSFLLPSFDDSTPTQFGSEDIIALVSINIPMKQLCLTPTFEVLDHLVVIPHCIDQMMYMSMYMSIHDYMYIKCP